MRAEVQPSRLLHIFDVPQILASGMPIAIFNQIRQQIAAGHTVLSVNFWPPNASPQRLAEFQAAAPNEPRIATSMRDLIRGVHELSGGVDQIYIHGLWSRSALCALFLPKSSCAKIRHAPHGALDQAAMHYGYLKKQFSWHLTQKWALSRAGTLIATSTRELEGIKRHLPRANIQLVPLSVPSIAPVPAPDGPRRRLLYFGRIHPIKGIGAILEAWKEIHQHLPDWDLDLIGPQEEPWTSHFKKQVDNLNLPRVSFHPEVKPDERFEALATGNLVLAPSLTENFGLVIAEALALGRTVIASEQTGWEARSGLVLFSSQAEFQRVMLAEASKISKATAVARAIS